MRQRVKRTFYQLMFILFTPLVICQTSNEFIAKGDDYNKKFDLKNPKNREKEKSKQFITNAKKNKKEKNER